MDTQENKRLVMEGYQMFQNGDIPHLLERYHDDALWVEPEVEHVPFSGVHKGKAAIAQFFQELPTGRGSRGSRGRRRPGRRCTIEPIGTVETPPQGQCQSLKPLTAA
jgi:hypothetical protein